MQLRLGLCSQRGQGEFPRASLAHCRQHAVETLAAGAPLCGSGTCSRQPASVLGEGSSTCMCFSRPMSICWYLRKVSWPSRTSCMPPQRVSPALASLLRSCTHWLLHCLIHALYGPLMLKPTKPSLAHLSC